VHHFSFWERDSLSEEGREHEALKQYGGVSHHTVYNVSRLTEPLRILTIGEMVRGRFSGIPADR